MKVTRNIDTGDEKQTIRTISTKPKEHFEGRWKSGRLYPLYSVVVNNGTTFISQNAKMKEEPYVIYDADKKEFKAPDGWLIKEMSADSRVTALGGGGEGGVTPEEVEEMIKDKVDKVDGKGLSTNDYDNTEKNKVASAYQKPNNGIPKSDLAKAVQDVLDDADGAYKKPVTGIPFTDLADGVQDSLSNADEAKAGLAGKQDTISDLSAIRSGAAAGATSIQPAEFNELKDEVDTIGNGAYEEAWDGDSTPVVADIPAGVVVTYSSASYTGTLAASASTVDKIYLVSDGNGNYDRYVTIENSGTYSWKKVGTTAIPLSDYATKAEVSQLQQEGYELVDLAKSHAWQYILISGTGKFGTNGSYTHKLIPCTPGDKFYIRAGVNAVRYAWFTQYIKPTSGATAPLVPGTDRYEIAAGIASEVTAPSSAAFLYIQLGDYTPASIEKVMSFSTRLLKIYDDSTNITDFDLSNPTTLRGYINGDGVWKGTGNNRHILLDAVPGSVLRIYGAYQGVYAFLTSDEAAVADASAPLVPGTTTHTIPDGETVEITVPEGTRFLYLYAGNVLDGNGGKNSVPSAVEFVNNIDVLKKETSEIEKQLNGDNLFVLSADNVTEGQYRNASGGINNLSGFFYSDPIPVWKGDIFSATVGSGSAQSTIALLSWVDENNNFISLILNPSESGTYTYEFLHDGYVCISGYSQDITGFSIAQKNLSQAVIDARARVNALEMETGTSTVKGISADDVKTGKYRKSSGGIATLANFFYSNPILVSAGDKFSCTLGSASAQSSIATLSWVDENNNFISLILNPSTSGSYNYNFQRSGFVCISGHTNDLSKYKIEFTGVFDTVKNLTKEISEVHNDVDNVGIDPATRLPVLSENPVEHIRFDCGLFAIFKTVGVIGDSLASGEMQGYKADGSMRYSDMYEFSWGQQLAKMTGVDVFNFSSGGQYAKAWMNGNTARTWDASGNNNGASVNLRQCYFIGLAHNDKPMVENNTYTAGIGTVADIDDADYTQNADSYVGWYARIIQALKSVEPRAYIFCITPPTTIYDSYSEQIRNIVEHFAGQRVYLIDLRQYGMAHTAQWREMGNHLSAAGYLYAAYEIANYVDWIIRNNGADFKYTSLVGTEIYDTDPTA